MGTIRRAAVIATAIGLAMTAGCSTGSDSGTTGAVDRARAATTPAAPASQTAAPASPTGAPATATEAAAQPAGGTTETSAGAAPAGRAGSEPVLTWTGLAGVRLGAKASAFATALRHDLGALDATDRQLLTDYRCVYRDLNDVPGLALRVTGADADGPVQVISLSQGSRIETSAGIGLGDGLDEVRRAYGAFLLDEQFDFWPADGHALTAQAADGARWTFIADAQNQLVEIRLGHPPDVYAPEGCA